MRQSKSRVLGAISIIALTILLAKPSYADFTYTVKSGDTLYKISSAYSSTIDGIKTRNNLTNDYLYINQKLVIPTTKFTEYSVVSGDTLWKIAEKFGTTSANVLSYNPNINVNNLLIGQKLVVPTASTASTSQYITYKVVSGDTLWLISVKYNVTIASIRELNNLTSDYLWIGQVLKIPATTKYTKDSVLASKITNFPFKTYYTPFSDTYNSPREWSPSGAVTRTHEALDMMAKAGTPVYAVASGVITNIGWNEYGGYRLMIKMSGADYYTYYAHFSGYANGMYIGKTVKAGELIGYVGSTGYGPEGTSGKFEPHLHLAIYKSDISTTVNPYPYIKGLE